jgi:pSer/pThr/pTyr-binding forkhead associated (FHA) protein
MGKGIGAGPWAGEGTTAEIGRLTSAIGASYTAPEEEEMAQLVIVSGAQEGTRFRLPARPVTAGRDPASEIQLLDPKVSRRHFVMVPVAGGYAVRALKSTNGVQVNGARIASDRVLADGDVIGAGDTRLVFSSGDDADTEDALRRFRRADRGLRDQRTQRDSDR